MQNIVDAPTKSGDLQEKQESVLKYVSVEEWYKL